MSLPLSEKRIAFLKGVSNLCTLTLLTLLPAIPRDLFVFMQTHEAERMIEKMEQDEDVLIERLKKVQDEQRKAYELLQESLES